MKINKKKIFALSGVFVIVLVIGLYIIFSETTLYKAVVIEFIEDSETYIIDKTDIKNIVFGEYKDLLGSPVSDVDLARLESKIEEHPSIKNADVYKKLDGILAIKIEHRIPIIRIMPVTGADFYIDKEGAMMPLSKMGSVRVPVATGNINYNYTDNAISVLTDTTISKTITDLFLISKYITDDSFLNAQIEHIYVKPNGEYELVPKVGKHIVLLGDAFEYEKKLKYLKHFYLNVMNKEGWRTYSNLNLKYKNQIVCTKTNS